MLTILFDGVAYGMLLFVLACGLAVTLGLMNFVNLAHGVFAMGGGYVTALMMNRAGVPFLATLPFAFVVPALAGVVVERLLYRRLYGASPLDQVLLTIGLMLMAMPAFDYFLTDQPQQIHLPAFLEGRFELPGLTIGVYRLFLIGVCGVIAATLQVFLVGTRFGAQLRAAVDDRARRRAGSASTSRGCSPSPSRSAAASPGSAARSPPTWSAASIRTSRSSSWSRS